MKNKSININQRIPLETLHASLTSYLNGFYSDEYVMEQLRLEFKGENRLKKGVRIVNKIIVNNPKISFINDNKAEFSSALKVKSDRNVILMSLLNIAFPFSYDLLYTFAKFFKVQDVVNIETIKKSMSNIYGGNRATENGIYSVVPMFIEAEFFKRSKLGIYEFNSPIAINSPLTYDLYKLSFTINNLMVENEESFLYNPYFKLISY